MNIGLFGGTFDPIHNGHLIIAELCRSAYALDTVIFIPSGNPPNKHAHHCAPAKDRYRMAALAIQDNPHFQLSPVEMYGNIRYTYQVIAHYRNVYPNDTLFFIIGSDSLADMHIWRKKFTLLNMCTFLVFPRSEKISVPEKIKQKVLWLPTQPIGISATMIRERIAQHKSVAYLIPHRVDRYITEKKLYGVR